MPQIIDKRDLLKNSELTRGAKIEFGCGPSKRDKASIGIDLLDYDGVDIVGDIREIFSLLPSDNVGELSSEHTLEHVEDLPGMIREMHRILQPGGILRVVVSHFSNAFYYSDPTHRNFFGLYTFAYYCEQDLFKRTIPSYARIEGLKLESIKLVFRSYRPRYISHAIRKSAQLLFNLNDSMKEIYEESFSTLLSCYEIEYIIRKKTFP
jgi:ubiquinone/menaquinone biosynthesis C-methylase UbiE